MRKKILCLATTMLLGLTLAACGKKSEEQKVQDVKDDVEEQTQDEKSGYKIEEQIEDKSLGIYYDINASFEPEQKKVPIYQMKYLEMNEENVAAFCDEIFDDGKYEIIKPYHVMSDDELKGIESELKSEVNAYSEETLPVFLEEQCNAAKTERYEREYQYNNEADSPRRIYEYETYDPEKIIHTSLNENGYEEQDGMVRGEIAGKKYFIQFKNSQFFDCDFSQSEYLMFPETETVKYQLAKKLSDEESNGDSDLIKQQQDASLMMVELGYKDYDCVSYYATKPVTRDSSNCPEKHYCFVFGYNLDGCVQGEYQTSIYGWNGDAPVLVNPNYVYVFTDENGVACIYFQARYEVEKSVDEYDTYISADRVKEGLNGYLTCGAIDASFADDGKVNIDTINFNYMIYYSEGKYYLSPTWMYSIDSKIDGTTLAITAVGAYDGFILTTSSSSDRTEGLFGEYGNEPPAYYNEEIEE